MANSGLNIPRQLDLSAVTLSPSLGGLSAAVTSVSGAITHEDPTVPKAMSAIIALTPKVAEASKGVILEDITFQSQSLVVETANTLLGRASPEMNPSFGASPPSTPTIQAERGAGVKDTFSPSKHK